MGGAARLNEAQLENLLEDAAAAAAAAAATAAQVPDSPSNFKLEDGSDHSLLQTLTLQSMLRHMEEIQVSASPPRRSAPNRKGHHGSVVIFSRPQSGCVYRCGVRFLFFFFVCFFDL